MLIDISKSCNVNMNISYKYEVIRIFPVNVMFIRIFPENVIEIKIYPFNAMLIQLVNVNVNISNKCKM